MKTYKIVLLSALMMGCSDGGVTKNRAPEMNGADFSITDADNFYLDGLVLSKSEIREYWLTSLSDKNPYLYMEVARAIIYSRKHKRTIYVLRDTSKNGMTFYYPALESGHGKDVVTIDYENKELRFDHFSDSDGPSIWDSAQKIWIDKKVKEINKEVKIFEFN